MTGKNQSTRRGVRRFRALIAAAAGVIVPAWLATTKSVAQPCEDEIYAAPVPNADEQYGQRIVIHGSIAAIAAPGPARGPYSQQGFVHLYEHGVDQEWNHIATLSSALSVPGARFGKGVAISDDVILVGAPYEQTAIGETGAVYVFVRPPGGWVTTDQPDAVIVPDELMDGDEYGSAIAMSDGQFLVGAPGDSAAAFEAGAVYRYDAPTESWSGVTHVEVMNSSEPRATEHFGYEIAMDGPLAVVAAPGLHHTAVGRVYVYRLQLDRQWALEQVLRGDPIFAVGDHFGRSIAIDRSSRLLSERIIVGSTGDDDHGEHSGSATIFRNDESNSDEPWVLEAELVPDRATFGDHVGMAVYLRGDTAIIGAPYANSYGLNSGVVFVYQQNASTRVWKNISIIQPDCPEPGAFYGTEITGFVVDHGTNVIVGAPRKSWKGAPVAGAAYVLRDEMIHD